MTVCQIVEQGGRVVALCPEETFGDLARSLPHWGVEGLAAFAENTLQFVVMGLVWKFWLGPKVKAWWAKHHNHASCDPQTQPSTSK